MIPEKPLISNIFRDIYDDFSNGTQRISALVGFLNLFVLISVWEERIGLPPITVFGSTTVVYILLIYIVGHFEKKVIKNGILGDKNGIQDQVTWNPPM
jgi:hypothetical protein